MILSLTSAVHPFVGFRGGFKYAGYYAMGYFSTEKLDFSPRLWVLDTTRPRLHMGSKIVIERMLIRNGISLECGGDAGAVSGVSNPRC